jgi:hypothetical protein
VVGDEAGGQLPGEHLGAVGVPPLVEAPAVGLDPLGLHVVGRVAGPGGVVEEERLVRRRHVRVLDHLDGVVGQVGVEVVAVLGRRRRRDGRVVLHQVGEPLARVATHEAVVALEAPAERPGTVRARARRLGGRGEVPLADGEGVVAGVAQDGRQEGLVGAGHAVVAGESHRQLDQRTDPHAVVVAPTQQARPGRRAQRRGVEVRVAQPPGGEPAQRGHLAAATEGGRLREADVVEHQQHDVGRALPRLGHRRPGRLRLPQGATDPPGERRSRPVA